MTSFHEKPVSDLPAIAPHLYVNWWPSMANNIRLLHCYTVDNKNWFNFLGCLLIKPGPLWRRSFGTNWSNLYPSYQRTGTTVPVPLITRTEPNPWLRNRKWHANPSNVRLISKQVIEERKFKISWYSPLFWPTEKPQIIKWYTYFVTLFLWQPKRRIKGLFSLIINVC